MSHWWACMHDESIADSDIHFHVILWFTQRRLPLDVGWITAADWDTLDCCIPGEPSEACSISDSDGENVIVQIDQLDITIATEMDRYNDEQMDLLRSAIFGWAGDTEPDPDT